MKVVFTNGCFDRFHYGHDHLLEACRTFGEYLIVAVNDDASVRRLKGVGRPLQPLEVRLRRVAKHPAVDAAIPFDGYVLKLLQILHPDVLVKGDDYTLRTIVGATFIQNRGGEVKIVERLPGFSTTELRGEMR